MINVVQMQQQMKQLQEQMEKVVAEQKKQEELEYKGANIRIKLVIADKTFMTSAVTLLSKQHGMTLFIEQFTKMHQKDNDQKENVKETNLQPGSVQSGKIVELYFDRNPDLFGVILDYLRGYDIKNTLHELKMIQLEKLKNDCVYFKIESLYNIIMQSLEARFNPYCGSPLLALSGKGTVATRLPINAGLHVSVPVFGVLEMPKHGAVQRYVEFNICSHGNRYIMIGVTESKPFKFGPYPGHAGVPGCSLYGANGHLYRSSGSEGWSAAWSYGDRIGVLVKLNKDNNTAIIAFYRNGQRVKNELNLTTYMNVGNGVLLVANLYSANEQVQIVQNPIVPH